MSPKKVVCVSLLVVAVLLIQSCSPASPTPGSIATIEAAIESTLAFRSYANTATALARMIQTATLLPRDSVSVLTPTPPATQTPAPTQTSIDSPAPSQTLTPAPTETSTVIQNTSTASSIPTDTLTPAATNTSTVAQNTRTPTRTATRTTLATVTPPPSRTPGATRTSMSADRNVPQVRVTIPSSCRAGPSRDYALLGGLFPGETAEVYARVEGLNYWVIKNPDGAGICWLWGGFAVVTGDLDRLMVFSLPEESATAAPTSTRTLPTATRTVPTATATIPSPTPTISPTPVPTATARFTPEPTIAVGSILTPGNYVCTLISIAPAGDSSFPPGADFDAHWTVQNSGNSTWLDSMVDFRYLSGTPLHKYDALYDLPENVAPGERIELIVDMIAPSSPGQYRTSWGITFGGNTYCELPLLINVTPPQ